MTVHQVNKIMQQSVNYFLILGFLVTDICGKIWGTSQFQKPIYLGFFGNCGQDMWVSRVWGYQQGALVSSECELSDPSQISASGEVPYSVSDERMGT